MDRFEAILLDMGRTFMFDVDRFSEKEDFGATYRELGGKALMGSEVHRIITALFEKMLSDSRNPNCYDRFPSVLDYLRGLTGGKKMPSSEMSLLGQVFATHEIGTVPDAYVNVLRQLRETHRLGVVSDIWSKSDLYLKEFDRAGIHDLFEVIIFSSDYGILKPSAQLFTKAIEALQVDPSKIVFVGDSLRRDIAGANAAGLSAIWINNGAATPDTPFANPDWVIHDLQDLLER